MFKVITCIGLLLCMQASALLADAPVATYVTHGEPQAVMGGSNDPISSCEPGPIRDYHSNALDLVGSPRKNKPA